MRTKREVCLSVGTTKVVEKDVELIIASVQKRMSIANRSTSGIKSYVRSVVRLYAFHGIHPKGLELDQVLDFLLYMQKEKGLHWRTIKLYVAGLRYYYQEIVDAVKLARQIPYPKEKPSLPEVVSREELQQLFEGCKNFKLEKKIEFHLSFATVFNYNDIFNTMKFSFDGISPYKQVGEFNFESNTINVNLSYRFGGGKYQTKSRKRRDNDEKSGSGGIF